MGTTISGDHRRSSSSGINSIKRTATSSSRANWANASTSPSLKPRSSTQFTFSGVSPASRAARTPATTCAKLPGTRVIRSKVAASTASMLTVTRFSPALRSGSAIFSSRCPLVVSARSSDSPCGVRMRASSCSISISPARSSGSPPVRRTFSMPSPTNNWMRRRYSSMRSSGYCAPTSPVRQ